MPATYESVYAKLSHYWALQDDAADTTIAAAVGGADGDVNSDNTEDITVAGPTEWLPKGLATDGSIALTFPAGPSSGDWTAMFWMIYGANSGTPGWFADANSWHFGRGTNAQPRYLASGVNVGFAGTESTEWAPIAVRYDDSEQEVELFITNSRGTASTGASINLDLPRLGVNRFSSSNSIAAYAGFGIAPEMLTDDEITAFLVTGPSDPAAAQRVGSPFIGSPFISRGLVHA